MSKTATITGPNGGVFLLAEVPEGAKDIDYKWPYLFVTEPVHEGAVTNKVHGIDLSPAELELIGKASELTDEQIDPMIDESAEHCFGAWTRVAVLRNICAAHSLNIETTVILKKIS